MSPFTETSVYTIRRKVFTLFGGAFHIYGPAGQVVGFARMKAFKLKEDFRVYSGEDQSQELLIIRARNVIDISATYDVLEPQTQKKIGALRRKGIKSILKDEWLLLDTFDQEIGIIREDSMFMALVRRFLANLIPQSYELEMQGTLVAAFKQNFNPFVLKITVDFSPDMQNRLDRRLGIAAALLLNAIEGRQG
jgi:hypothetical protein